MVTRNWKKGGYRNTVSVWEVEKFLEMDGGMVA